ncbi:MAG TPA: tRNA (adenosine(37)-N6)-dimethylallyltransferase MiaA [Polyangiaceae bacterium]
MEPELPPPETQSPLLVIVGPTASGKTSLALRIAEAAGGEIISADSVQVYRGFDIGAGKPTPEERARVPHHLIDVADPGDPMDAASWAVLADQAIAQVRARGRLPVVCGGTFLWVRSLLFGLAAAPPADPVIRERHRVLAETGGRGAVHGALRQVDPAAAARLSPNDFIRVSRALEVFELTGTPQTEWHARHGFREPRYAAKLVGIRFTAEELSARIAARVHGMFAAGLVDEVRRLVSEGHGRARATQSVGYRQVLEMLDAQAQGPTPIDLVALEEAIVRATRVFARRQRTWLRDQPVQWLTPEAAARFTP